MKKYFLYTILTSLLITTACSDQLERTPIDSLVEETAFQTVDDLNAGLRGAMSGLNPDNMVAFNAIFADNARIGVDNGGQQLGLINQQLNPAGGDQGLWANRYNVLNRINRVLAASESITPAAIDQARYNNIVGQLYALRGYLHSELLFYYGLDFSIDNTLGVIYQNFVATDGFRERNTTGEVLSFINEDFDMARTMITSTDINYPTDDFIDFQKARIALYTGNYNEAISLANLLIGKYSLAGADEYAAMFGGDANTKEIVFKFDNVQGANNSVAGNFIFTGTGGNFVEGAAGLYDAFTATDIRRDVVFTADSDPDGEITINKYPPNADALYINDYKEMRISEMYLIRAEAYAMSSQFASAQADVQTIRTTRQSSAVTPLYSSIAEAIEDIKAERRLELCFEGHRYMDIKRYKDILNIGIERDQRDATHLGQNFPVSIGVNAKEFTFPIPIGEINGNPDITQADGYSN